MYILERCNKRFFHFFLFENTMLFFVFILKRLITSIFKKRRRAKGELSTTYTSNIRDSTFYNKNYRSFKNSTYVQYLTTLKFTMPAHQTLKNTGAIPQPSENGESTFSNHQPPTFPPPTAITSLHKL